MKKKKNSNYTKRRNTSIYIILIVIVLLSLLSFYLINSWGKTENVAVGKATQNQETSKITGHALSDFIKSTFGISSSDDSSTSTGGGEVTSLSIPTNGLVAQYLFEGNANDGSGNGNDGTVFGGVTFVQGQEGHGLSASFNGIDSKIDIPNSATLGVSGNQLTLAVWIYYKPSSDYIVPLGKIVQDGSHFSPYFDFGMALTNGDTSKHSIGHITNSDGSFNQEIGSALILPNTWFHLTTTYDGSNICNYINGVLDGSCTSMNGNLLQSGDVLRLGRNGAGGEPLKGMIDEVAIYNRVLSLTEIQDLMNGGTGGSTNFLSVTKSGTGLGTVTGTGINCGTDCFESYTDPTTITLTATASSGSTFTGWSGTCSGTSSCIVTVEGIISVGATFNLQGGTGGGGQTTFNLVTVESGSTNPLSPHVKATGDINGDGLLDLIIGSAGGQGIVYYEVPTWTKNIIVSSGSFSTDMEAADMNNDGKIDIIVPEGSAGGSPVWFENPTWARHQISPSMRTHDIEISDFDNDGKMDVATRGQGGFGSLTGNKIQVFKQNSLDSWSLLTLSNGIAQGEGLDVADMNQDGKQDLVIAGTYFINPGADILTNTWTPVVYDSLIPETEPGLRDYKVEVGDISGDGLNDIAISTAEGTGPLNWYQAPSIPSGSWTKHQIKSAITFTHGLGMGDFNQDGKLDLATSEMAQSVNPDDVIVYYNKGSGLVWDEQTIYTLGSHNIVVSDIDNDNDPDIFGANWDDSAQDSSAINLWVNEYDPTKNKLSLDSFSSAIQVTNTRDAPYFGIGFNDLNADGYKDIFSGKFIYLNPGGNMQGLWIPITLPVTVDAMLSLDVDGDSFADIIGVQYLIAPSATQNVYWLEATNSQGTSWTSTVVGSIDKTSHPSIQGYTLAQIVPGGRQEIILSAGNGNGYFFQIPTSNPQAGNWQRIAFTNNGNEEGISAGDIDKDGSVDLVSAGSNDQTIYWRQNPNDLTSLNWQSFLVGTTTNAFDRNAVADIDGDGKLDVIATEETSSTGASTYWFKQPADPTTTPWQKNTIVTQYTTNNLDVRDMDGDLDIDIVTAEHRGTKKLSIWENNGQGIFTEHVVSTGIESHLGARTSDLDGDGDFDIASIAFETYQNLYIWRNDAKSGSGKFALGVTKSGSGSGTVSGNGINCGSICNLLLDPQTTVTLTATADAGSTFTGWSGDCSGTGTCVIAMSSAKNVDATFNTQGTIPNAPSGLSAIVESSSSIRLSWTDNSNNENGFYLERSVGDSVHFEMVSQISANDIVYTDTGLSGHTIYYYRIQSFNGQGTSTYSNIVSATTQNNPPTIAPIGNKNIDEGTSLLFNVIVSDPDEDTITYTVEDLPAGASFDLNTELGQWIFTWKPNFDQFGGYVVIFGIDDGNGGTDSEGITIDVADVPDRDGDSFPDSIDCNDESASTGLCTGCSICSDPNGISGSCIVDPTKATKPIECNLKGTCGGDPNCASNEVVIYSPIQTATCEVTGNVGTYTTCVPDPGCVYEASCDIDSDSDGVLDHDDKCPSTPSGEKVNLKNGCQLPKNFESFTDPLTTKFGEVDNLLAVPKLILGNSNGRIEFQEVTSLLSLSPTTNIFEPLDLSMVTIKDKEIGLDTTAKYSAELDKLAELTFITDTSKEYTINKDGTACPTETCTLISAQNNELKILVAGFSTYTIVEKIETPKSDPPSNPPSGGGGGGGSRKVSTTPPSSINNKVDLDLAESGTVIVSRTGKINLYYNGVLYEINLITNIVNKDEIIFEESKSKNSIILGVGSEGKIEIDSIAGYDATIKVSSISDSFATVQVSRIIEEGSSVDYTTEAPEKISLSERVKVIFTSLYFWWILVTLIIMILVVVIGLYKDQILRIFKKH